MSKTVTACRFTSTTLLLALFFAGLLQNYCAAFDMFKLTGLYINRLYRLSASSIYSK